MNETALPPSGVHAMTGSVPTWSMTTPLPEALAEPGMVMGTGTPHESPSARTLRPVMVWVSVEKMYSMLGLHWLSCVSTVVFQVCMCKREREWWEERGAGVEGRKRG